MLLHEEVEKFRTQNKRRVNDRETAKLDQNQAQQLSLASGNYFESLAKTNPELFSKAKLLQIKSSENIVDAFNKYLDAIMTEENARAAKFVEDHSMELMSGDEEALNKYYYSFNTAVFTGMSQDAQKLMMLEGLSEDEAQRAINEMWIPESLTEEGCRTLINIRIKNNRLLTDSLTKMLKTNYTALGISEAEAAGLISELADDNTNHQAIGKIKEFLQDPKKLEKFKLGKNNYDFRPIGGGVLFLSEDPSIQFSQHPSKNLARIFQYDAIVVGHGNYEENSASASAKDIKAGMGPVRKELIDSISDMRKLIKSTFEDNEFAQELLKDEATKKNIEEFFSELDDLEKVAKDLTKEDIDIKDLARGCNDVKASLVKITKRGPTPDELKAITRAYNATSAIVNRAIAIKDPKQAMKDGSSTEWSVQPIDTLTTSDNSRMIDILNALKKEGFKNVFIGACNPGNVSLPKYIKDDKEFKVSMGSASVYLEMSKMDDPIYRDYTILENRLYDLARLSGSPFEYYTLNELYAEMENTRVEALNEGALDALKALGKKAIQLIIELWHRLVGFLKGLYSKIKEFVMKRFGKHSNAKLKSSIEIPVIAISSGKAMVSKVNGNTPEELSGAIIKANSSISNYIDKTSNTEASYIKKLQALIDSGKLKKKAEVHESSGIFDAVKFI